MKIDAVPGVITDFRATPTRRGNYPVVCAELCGLGHAYMRQTARVVTREQFDRQMRTLRDGGGTPGASDAPGQAGQGGEGASAGKPVFEAQGCGGCHTLSDAGASGTTGPNLDDVLEAASADDIRKSIVEPNADVTEGFQEGIMPPYKDRIPPKELDALVEYLEESTR
jgi:cytochrome c oxidase subunit 2